jgi:hypothetical protein
MLYFRKWLAANHPDKIQHKNMELKSASQAFMQTWGQLLLSPPTEVNTTDLVNLHGKQAGHESYKMCPRCVRNVNKGYKRL